MSKTLRLDDDAIQKCVGVCDEMLEQLDDALKKASRLDRVTGFGGFASAIELQDGYQQKFSGGDGSGSVAERLNQFRLAIELMRQTFVDGGQAFGDADSAIQRALGSIQGSL